MSGYPETVALAMIYPMLPEHLKHKVLLQILQRSGFKFSPEDLKAPALKLEKLEKPITFEARGPIPIGFHCGYCAMPIGEEPLTMSQKAKLMDEHLSHCPIFQVIAKHMRGSP